MAIEVRQQPRTAYITETRLVGADELPDFIRSACTRLLATATIEMGGVTGPATVLYPEPVTKTVDGHVTTAIPVAEPSGVPAEHVLIEEACEMAVLRIAKSQVAFPDILAAYDDVFAWLEAKEYLISGAPREIYFTDFAAAAPEDLVCDIAVPFVRNK